jgi:hypothetical protein
MAQGRLGRDPGERVGVERAERPAGCGQDDLGDLGGIAAIENLEDRVVLAVDRQDAHAPRYRGGSEQGAGADQRLLVRKRHRAGTGQGGHGRRETGGADDRGQDDVGRTRCRLDHRGVTGGRLDAGPGQPLAEVIVARGIRDHGETGPHGASLSGQQVGIVPCDQRLDAVAVRLAGDEIDRAPADGPGGPEHGDPDRAARSLGGGFRGRMSDGFVHSDITIAEVRPPRRFLASVPDRRPRRR